MQRVSNNTVSTNDNNTTPLARYFSIHYIPELSERIVRNIQNEIKDVKVACRVARYMCFKIKNMSEKYKI
jgi:hypothetical protein